MSVIKIEFATSKKHLILWLSITSIIIIIMFLEFISFYKNPEMITQLEHFPKQLMKVFSVKESNLTTFSGFLSMASIYIYILGAAFAVILGSNSLSIEERNRTSEFIFSFPISRERILLYKWIVNVVLCLTFSVFTFIVIFLVSVPNETNVHYLQYLLLITASLFLTQIVFLTLGMLLASFIKSTSKSNAYALGFVIISYLIHLIMEISGSLTPYKYMTPLNFFDSNEMLNHLYLDPCGIGLTLSLSLLFLASTFYLYSKRDLTI